MSVLNVANISDDQSTLSNNDNPEDALNNTTTIDTKFVTNGTVKAWTNFNGADTLTVRGSLNITSVSDIDEGKYSANFTSSFNRVPSTTGSMTITNYAGVMRVNPSTGACQLFTATAYAPSAYMDSINTSMQSCGDLA